MYQLSNALQLCEKCNYSNVSQWEMQKGILRATKSYAASALSTSSV